MNTRDFIQQYREGDVRQLALQGARFPEVDMPFALDQIAGWQTARKKLPTWAATEGITYPPHLSMEQCSSEQTARYKAQLAKRLLSAVTQVGERQTPTRLLDLTGGFGVDFSWMSRMFNDAVYVERQSLLCSVARQNFQLLGLEHVEVVCDDAEHYLSETERVDMIFLDPARRDTHGTRTYAIADCTPDVMALSDLLVQKARWVVVKLSPMLDWHKAVEDLVAVCEVHIIATGNECKELLLVLKGEPSEKGEQQNLTVHCVNDDQSFSFVPSCHVSRYDIATDIPGGYYLYEPNASVMKAGCYDTLADRYKLTALSMNSHLFISSHLMEDFPGRRFRVIAVSSMNKQAVKELLKNVDRANIAVRNFPLTVAELRKRLKLADGGDRYLFGTTSDDGKHLLILTEKV